MLSQLPGGIVFITGTNGKTTTTKTVVEMLEANGVKVLTNATGSNMVRGLISGIIRNAKITAKLPYDIAVFEVDEASIRPLVKKIKPNWVLALNVSRDQLDRFGEVDTIARHIGTAMEAATEGIITNARDPNLLKVARPIAEVQNTQLSYFGVADKLSKFFPSDYELAAVTKMPTSSSDNAKSNASVELTNFSGQTVEYRISGQTYKTELKLSGQHNYLNGAAALALVGKLLPQTSPDDLVKQLSQVSIAFGRGESYKLKNKAIVELVLVKNPASFRQALASYSTTDNNLMIAINDNLADGRDTSWLWDVDFTSLGSKPVYVTSGTRAADMALRLSYDNIKVAEIEMDLHKALMKLSKKKGSNVILATYTAMLSLYNTLNKTGERLS